MSIPQAVSQAQRPAIQVQGLEKSYKELRVLRGVDFEVAPGSIFALLGSNGAGKTTVVRILSTLLAADAGSASVNGFDVSARPGRRARVDQPHRAVRGGGRDPQRAGEPRPGRPASAPQEPGRDRGRAAAAVLADRGGRPAGGDVLRWHAPPSGHRDEPDRESAGHLPRRADQRAGPGGADRGVAGRQGARRRAGRPCCSRPSTWTRPSSWPTGSRSCTRAGSSSTAPWPSSSSCCRPPRSSTSRSSPPSRTSSSRSWATASEDATPSKK